MAPARQARPPARPPQSRSPRSLSLTRASSADRRPDAAARRAGRAALGDLEVPIPCYLPPDHGLRTQQSSRRRPTGLAKRGPPDPSRGSTPSAGPQPAPCSAVNPEPQRRGPLPGTGLSPPGGVRGPPPRAAPLTASFACFGAAGGQNGQRRLWPGLARAGAPPDLGTAGRFPRHRVTCPTDSTILILPRGDGLQELVPSGHQGAEAGEERLPWNLAWLQVPPLRRPPAWPYRFKAHGHLDVDLSAISDTATPRSAHHAEPHPDHGSLPRRPVCTPAVTQRSIAPLPSPQSEMRGTLSPALRRRP
ncbi:basic salivary proline-rich protein 4-like [Pteropus medius]|uniref:basic salivary proline-rich protein 4-like n=1 Tax=Pteropus vampyrus TaxID=132908 RepID=UPI00196A6FB8|nr:basic salivary proline-rich protein 4-like [Pteropus giganteus]